MCFLSVVLLKEVANKDHCIGEIRQERKQLKQQLRRLQSKLSAATSGDGDRGVKKRKCLDPDHDSCLQLKTTKSGKRLTLQGTLALAIRRNFSNISTEDIGAVLLKDLSRFTVTRAEVRAGTALVASSRLFFHSMYHDLVSPGKASDFRFALHSFKQDATNSGLMKGSKFCALILRSCYLRENIPDQETPCSDIDWDNFDVDDWVETLVRVSDVLPVRDGSSEATVSQTLKQLDGLGATTWKTIADDPILQNADMLHWFTSTTDAGPNEIGARKILQAEMKDLPNVLYTDFTCLEHSQHLCSLLGLKAADRCLKGYRDWKYYSSLATCSNVCRDLSKELFAEWTATHGYKSAVELCKTLWPKACSGRWSGCEKPEERLLLCGEERLTPILERILEKRQKSRQKDNDTTAIDDLAIEETKAYSAKMSRWKKKTLECVRDGLWWRCVKIMHSCRGPLAHFSFFLRKRQDQWGHLAQLCCGKQDAIRAEFDDVWRTLLESGCLSDQANPDDDVGDKKTSDAQFARNFATLC